LFQEENPLLSTLLAAGATVKEIATRDATFTDARVLQTDTVGLLFEVRRTVSEGGNVEEAVSRIMVPWPNVRHVVLLEERT
jgi:hypothetical protein